METHNSVIKYLLYGEEWHLYITFIRHFKYLDFLTFSNFDSKS